MLQSLTKEETYKRDLSFFVDSFRVTIQYHHMLEQSKEEIQAVLPDIEGFCKLGGYLSMPI